MNHGSLFSGIGGFDLAAEKAGYNNVFHVEIDNDNREHLELSFPNTNSYADIREFDGRPYSGTIDIISGGFPCQDISIAKTHSGGGKAQGIKGTKSGLWKEYARLVREIGPGIICFENSSMLLTRGLEHVLCDLSKLGYDAEWRCFYASQFGYPHFRPRVYGLAYSRCHRWHTIIEKGGILQKVPTERAPRQNRVPMPSKRYDGQSDFGGVLLDDGFYSGLDQKKIFGYGNAVVVDIPLSIFETLNGSL
jgi:DNA (cytosine-5)-methyltransferase 1